METREGKRTNYLSHFFFIQGMYIDQPPAGAGIYNSTQAYLLKKIRISTQLLKNKMIHSLFRTVCFGIGMEPSGSQLQ